MSITESGEIYEVEDLTGGVFTFKIIKDTLIIGNNDTTLQFDMTDIIQIVDEYTRATVIVGKEEDAYRLSVTPKEEKAE
jgi:hypothetical protein